MAGPHHDLRLFVALHPPMEIALSLLRRIAQLDVPANRPVPADHIHLTLQFIGNVAPSHLDETIESVQRSVAGLHSFDMQLPQLICLPRRGHARLIAAEADQPATLMEIQRRLAQRLAHNPRSRPGDRFLPHVTLTRFKTPTRFKLDQQFQTLPLESFHIDSIALMRSILRPEGAIHAAVQQFQLRQ